MITIQKHPALVSGMNMHIGRQIAMATRPVDQPHLSARRVTKDTLRSELTAKQKQIAANTQNMTAGMRRIFEQYKSGTYCTDDYSTRTCQRHRRYFMLKINIDLRKPYMPIKPSDSEPISKQRTNYLLNARPAMSSM